MTENSPLSLYELNALVRRSVTSCMPGTYWLQAELSDVRSNYSGHCYLEFVQKESLGETVWWRRLGEPCGAMCTGC